RSEETPGEETLRACASITWAIVGRAKPGPRRSTRAGAPVDSQIAVSSTVPGTPQERGVSLRAVVFPPFSMRNIAHVLPNHVSRFVHHMRARIFSRRQFREPSSRPRRNQLA